MGTSLTGLEIRDTYDALLKITDNGPLSGTAKYLSDGLGNDSALALSTGDIGIGTTSLLSASGFRTLTMNGSSASLIELQGGGTSYARIQANSSEFAILARGNAPMVFYTNPSASDTERMRITSAGNVGIGTSSPDQRLTIQATGGANGLMSFKSALGTTTSFFGVPNANGDIISTSTTADLCLRNETGSILFQLTGSERARFTTNGLTFNGDTAAANALDDYEEGTWTGTLTPNTSGTITLSAGTQPFGYTKIGRQVTITGLAVVSSVSSPVGVRIRLGGLPFTVANSAAARAGGAVTFFDASASYAFTAVNGYVEPNLSYVLINFDSSTLAANDEFAFTYTYFV